MLLLTLARDLRRRKARERRTLFVAEGVRTVEELLRSPLTIRGVLASRTWCDSERGQALLAELARRQIACDQVTDAEFLSAADTENPQGVLAVAEIPGHTFEAIARTLGPAVRLLVLDAVQDPGNAGTLVRTGAALGSAAIVALGGTADLWNAKAIRSAAGAQFRLPTLHCTIAELMVFLQAQAISLWGTASDGTPVGDATPPPRLALAVGNEGAGLSVEVRQRSERVVSLPMSSGIESLNVAVAAGIVLYALRP